MSQVPPKLSWAKGEFLVEEICFFVIVETPLISTLHISGYWGVGLQYDVCCLSLKRLKCRLSIIIAH